MERNHMLRSHQFRHNTSAERHQYYSTMPHQQPYIRNMQHHQQISSSSWAPYYVPITISHGNNIYRVYQLIPTHQMRPHQQYLPSASYGYLERRSSVQQNGPARDYNNLTFQLLDATLILPMFPPPSPIVTENMLRESQELTRTIIATAKVEVNKRIEANLTIKIHTPSNAAPNSDEELDICVICQEMYQNKEKIGALKCGHEYHVECIKKWLSRKNMCPICKATALPY